MLPVDTLIHAAWILPIEPADQVLEDHAIAVHQGCIVALGHSSDMAARFNPITELHLAHHAVMPGLVNAHGHAAMTLLRGLADDQSLMTWLQQWIWPTETRWVGEQFVRDGTRLAIAEMLASGTTCFSDMYFFPDAVAEAVIESGMRAQIAFPVLERPSSWAADADQYLAKGLEVRDRFKQNPRLGFAIGPHAPYTNSDATLARIAVLSAQLDMPVHMHVQETAHEVAESISLHGMRPLERLDRLGLVTPRLQAVHLTQLSATDLELLAREGVQVVHCPSSNLKLASGFCPVQSLLEHGANVCLGTDCAASNNTLDLFAELRLAALLAKAASADPIALCAPAALRLATLGGAQALGLGERIGSLLPGKDADMIAIDLQRLGCTPVYDVCSTLAYTASGGAVTHVWVEGRLLLEDGVPRTLEPEVLIDAAHGWRARIRPDLRRSPMNR